MDPPTLINESSYPSANGGPYNFSEIWPFPINGGGESSEGGRLELRRPPFAADLSHFAAEAAAVASNREKDSIGGGEERHGGGGSARKRRRRDATEEDSAANSVSTSSANAAVRDSLNFSLLSFNPHAKIKSVFSFLLLTLSNQCSPFYSLSYFSSSIFLNSHNIRL